MAMLQEISKELNRNTIGYIEKFIASIREIKGDEVADEIVELLFRKEQLEVALCI